MSKVVHRKKRLSSFKLIVLGFAAVILSAHCCWCFRSLRFPEHRLLFMRHYSPLFQRYVSQGLLYRTPAVTGLLLVRQLFCCWSRPAGWVSSPLLFPLPFYPDGNFAHAAQYNAGCNFCTENRRYCPPDQIQRTGYIIYWIARHDCHASGFLPWLWHQRHLDGSLSLCICILQCRFWPSGNFQPAVCISEQIHCQPTDQPRNYAFDHNWWHRLSDVGRYLQP